MGVDDAALIKRWRSDRDGEAFAELVARYSGLVYGACRRVTRDNGRSEDLSQECFLKLAVSRPVVKGSLGPWLHRVATNLALDEVRASGRRARRDKGYTLDKVEPAEPEWSDVEPIVDEAVQALPDLVRVPIVLHFYEGRTQEAIAELTDAPRSTVANRIKRGVEEVRKSLRRRGVEIPAAALTAFLATELAVAAPAGLTTSIGKAALAGRLPQPVASNVSWAGRIAIASSIVAVIGLTLWLRPESPEAPDTFAAEEAVQEITAAPSVPVDESALVEAEPEEAVKAPPVKEVQSAITPAPEDDAGPSVSGTITHISGAPVPGALVRLMPKDAPASTGVVEHYLEQYGMAYTDTDGNYTISDIQLTGQVVIAAAAPGFLEEVKHLTIAEGDQRKGFDFALEATYDFAGRVLDARGRPVEGALVVPLEMDPRLDSELWRRWRLTDKNGMFYYALQRTIDVEEGRDRSNDWKDRRLVLEVSAQGRGSDIFYDVLLAAGEVVEFRLPASTALNGTLVSGDGTPLPNYTVMFSGVYREVVNPDGSLGTMPTSRHVRKTDAQGRYEIQGFPPNISYSVSLRDQDGGRVPRAAHGKPPLLQPGSSARFDLTANLGVMLTGDVIGAPSGNPVLAFIVVSVLDVETERFIGWPYSPEGESSYSIRLSKPGTYLVDAVYNFYVHEPREASSALRNEDGVFVKVEVGAGDNRVDVTVPDPFVLPFHTVDADGLPVESAELRIGRMTPKYVSDLDGSYTHRRTDRNGRHTAYAMPGKEIWVSATADGYSTARTPHFVGEPGEVHPEIELVLRKPGDVLGRLVGPDGKLVQSGRFKISVFNRLHQDLIYTGIDIDGGLFRFPGVLVEDNLHIMLMYNRREIWTEPYLHEGPADVDLDFGDITVSPEP